ncbi:MAG: hypothetical protein GX413_12785, partial [Acetobacter sp.]|nr:hypothetical protein [Acetobacter sp.]
ERDFRLLSVSALFAAGSPLLSSWKDAVGIDMAGITFLEPVFTTTWLPSVLAKKYSRTRAGWR